MSIPRPFPSSPIDDSYASRDTGLDDTIESSFPASDPPSSIPDPTSRRHSSRAAGRASRSVRIGQRTIGLPSDRFLWGAIGAVGVSALLLAVFARLVRQLDPDRYDPA
jgi:hypothetical protein